MKIGYILGMKNAIHRFIYRELCYLDSKNVDISIFTTKCKKGTYNPKDNWHLYKFNPIFTIFYQIIFLLKNPIKHFKMLFFSLKTKSLVNYLIATYYSRIINKNNIDRIHAHFGDHKLYVAYYVKRITGIPLTVTIHAHELYRNPNWKMFKIALDYCDKIITISDYNKKYLIDNFKIDSKKIQTIRLFVDASEVTDNDTKKILVVGSFEERKGYDDLLKAIQINKNENFIVWIVGKGHMDIVGMAENMGISHKIKFFGHLHADILDVLFDSCDFFCLPSKTVKVEMGIDCEGIPVALMEAMMHKKPVLTTKHVGIPELVNEVLVPEGDYKELAKKMKWLINNPQEYKKMGDNNRKVIETDYSIKNTDKLLKVFKE